MPNKLRVLSGDDLISFFESVGFTLSFSKGSHCKMSRMTSAGKQVIVVPRHKTVTKGTLKSIFNKASLYIDEVRLRKFFYTDS